MTTLDDDSGQALRGESDYSTSNLDQWEHTAEGLEESVGSGSTTHKSIEGTRWSFARIAADDHSLIEIVGSGPAVLVTETVQGCSDDCWATGV